MEGDVNYLNPRKLDLRRRSIRFDDRRTCLIETCAGKGLLTKGLYIRNYPLVISIEKDRESFAYLKRRFRDNPRVLLFNADCLELIEGGLLDKYRFSAIDVDTFGQPVDIIEAVFERTPRGFLLMVTDGGLTSAKRRFDDSLIKKYRGKAKGFTLSSAYDRFGYLHTNFVAECAKGHGFRAVPLMVTRNRRGSALYSSFLVERGV